MKIKFRIQSEQTASSPTLVHCTLWFRCLLTSVVKVHCNLRRLGKNEKQVPVMSLPTFSDLDKDCDLW